MSDDRKLRHVLGKLIDDGAVADGADPGEAVAALRKKHPEYERRDDAPLRAAVRDALAARRTGDAPPLGWL